MTFSSEEWLANQKDYNPAWEQYRANRMARKEWFFYKLLAIVLCSLSALIVIGGLTYVFS